jgi:hypothetical protein|tara:strand:+ start:40 stop:876 length:837 start_codon:yes stop_codon:yes gene_type:complete
MSILNSFTPVVNPDGTISYFPNTLQSEPGIPFRSMVDMENMNSGLFSDFDQSPNIVDKAQDLNEAVKRRTLFSTNFQDPYYLNTGIMTQAPNLLFDVNDVQSRINAAKNREALNREALNRQGLLSLDDAGYTPPVYEEFPQKAKPGLNLDFAKQIGSSVLGLLTGNPIVGLLARGIGALGDRFRLPGTVGGMDLRGDTGFDTFRRSTSLADFLQRRRDKRAREEIRAIGEEKRRMEEKRKFDQNLRQYFSGSQGGGDSGGRSASDFDPSDPTATEGPF